jgi:hypothetical protein
MENKDKDKDNGVGDSNKDNMFKDWGLPNEAKGGLGEGKERIREVRREIVKGQKSEAELEEEGESEVRGRSRQKTQGRLQERSKIESELENQLRRQLGEEVCLRRVFLSPIFHKERILSERKCMGDQGGRKEDYVGKTMGRLGTLNWEEWERTRAP